MRLADLEPGWVGAGGEGVTRNGQPVPARHGVGLGFNCPCGCGDRCYVGFENPLDGKPYNDDGAPKWLRTGDTFDTLTLAPSIQRLSGCRWHGFIEAGNVRTVQ
jgi:hypothetical protein